MWWGKLSRKGHIPFACEEHWPGEIPGNGLSFRNPIIDRRIWEIGIISNKKQRMVYSKRFEEWFDNAFKDAEQADSFESGLYYLGRPNAIASFYQAEQLERIANALEKANELRFGYVVPTAEG